MFLQNGERTDSSFEWHLILPSEVRRVTSRFALKFEDEYLVMLLFYLFLVIIVVYVTKNYRAWVL